MGECVEIAKVLVSPCEKLMTMIGGAIGKVYEPKHVRRMADAHAYELSTIGAAMRELSDINTTYKDGDVALFTEDFQRLMQRTQNRMALQEITKQQNIESVVDKAYKLLEFEDAVTDEPVDQDWIRRFFNITGEISNSEMQEIWARILSGEIKHPGSFSMRTLETIRNMRTEEAQVFQKIMPLILYSDDMYFILSRENIPSEFKVPFSDIMLLDECGLMDSSGMLTVSFHISKKQSEHILSDKFIINFNGRKEEIETIVLGAHPLTRAGQELFNILEHTKNEKYIFEVANYLFTQNKDKITLSVHEIISRKRIENKDSFEYTDPLVSYSAKTDQ